MKQQDVRPILSKAPSEIEHEWDSVARLRLEQITLGRDLSYSSVLEPATLDLIGSCDRSNVLDVGCGVGVLTARLAQTAARVTGIDLSAESIHLAREHTSHTHNLRLVKTSVEEFARTATERFTLVVANMVLMTVLDLPAAVGAITNLLMARGKFVFTITHPWFWPMYWRYDQEDWFDYTNEIMIEGPFTISADGPSPFVTTHVHRPLEKYVSTLGQCGLIVESLCEPKPRGPVTPAYIENWRYPRFLAIMCTRPS